MAAAVLPSKSSNLGEPGREMFTTLPGDPHFLVGGPCLALSQPPVGWEGGCLENRAGLPGGALAHAWGRGGGMPVTPGWWWAARLGQGGLSGGGVRCWVPWQGCGLSSWLGWDPHSLCFCATLVLVSGWIARWGDAFYVLYHAGVQHKRPSAPICVLSCWSKEKKGYQWFY